MTRPAPALPSARLVVRSAVVEAGLRALLGGAGVAVPEDGHGDADVWITDDSLLPDPEPLDGAPALVALGNVAWAALLPDLTAGGWAALPADATPAELLAGVLGAAAGLAVLPPDLALHPQEHPEHDDPDDLGSGDLGGGAGSDVALTPRERDVLNLLTEGLSNKRAARTLGVSESTVKFHVAALYSKLGVQSRAAAVARGIQLGLVSV